MLFRDGVILFFFLYSCIRTPKKWAFPGTTPPKHVAEIHQLYTDPGTGFNIDVMDRLKHNIKFDSLKPHQKNVSLIWDEIHIKSGLAFSRPTGKLIGYTEMGDINNDLKAFERQLEQEEDEDRELATIVLTFMVRGLFTYCNYPIGFFASHNGFDGSQLYPLVWEAVRVCESQGLLNHFTLNLITLS